MSNIVSIRTQVRDPIAIRSACSRLQLREPVYGPTQLFTNTKLSVSIDAESWAPFKGTER